MAFSFDNYKPINYKTWDFSGQGKNIKNLLTSTEWRIWNETLPLQDKRDDLGHGEIVTYFASKLAKYYFDIDREIAITAAMLHDIGYGKIEGAGEKHREAIKMGTAENVDHRKVHQDLSVGIAREILPSFGYDQESIDAIAHIIGDHDTRLKEHKLEGKVMMDADIIWRFTLPCFKAYKEVMPPKNKTERQTEIHSPEELLISYYEEMELLKKGGRFYLQESEKIARIELINTMINAFPNKAPFLLEKNYSAELKKVQDFYK